MKAIICLKPGGKDVLEIASVQRPEVSDDDVLIELHACGLNRPDILQREGLYPAPKGNSDILGLEGAGVIVEKGKNVHQWSVGDRVMALLPGGGYAEFAKVNHRHVMPIPDTLTMIEAACLPETSLTVWYNVFERANLQSGQTFLVHGGGSGIGTTAIQLAKAHGATVFTTAGSDDKCQKCLDLGADLAINYKTQDFVDELKAATQKQGVDIILDMVGGSYVDKNVLIAKDQATIIHIGFLESSMATVNFARVMMKRLNLTGSTLRHRTDLEKADIVHGFWSKCQSYIENGLYKPVIDTVFDFQNIQDAHDYLEKGQHFGKIALKIC